MRGLLALAFVMSATPLSAQAAAPTSAGCHAPEQRQFDFWVGEWNVSPSGNAKAIAESSITSHDQGCVILENWRPFEGPHAHSLNSYDTSDGRWHQTYVDATGKRTEMAGRFESGIMRFDIPGPSRTRMNYQSGDANTVRQWGERQDAASGNWIVIWDLTYRRRSATK